MSLEKTKRARASKRKGWAFETQVIKYLTRLGYKASRKVLSGANLKTPYDVLVSPIRLKLEAKRTMKDGISIQTKWLDRISPQFALVFATGVRISRSNIMYAISEGQQGYDLPVITITEGSKRIRAYEGHFSVGQGKNVQEMHGRFLLAYGDRQFLVQPFVEYMERWPIQLKENNDGVGTDGETV